MHRVGAKLVTLKPRNISVWVMLDRSNHAFGKVESEISIQGNVGITVYIQKQNLTLAPELGEIIEESNGDQHVIGEIKDLGFRWQCFCSSEPIA